MILTRDILEGDQEAQRIFYNKYRTILNDYIYSKYPNNYDLEDDVSEILIKISTNLYKYDPEKASVKTWAFAIAKNYMIDKSRSPVMLTGSITISSDSIGLLNTNISTSDVTYINPEDGNWHYTGCRNTFSTEKFYKHCLKRMFFGLGVWR